MNFDFSEQIKQKTNEELIEIFTHPKNYSPDFIALAENELVKRNVNIDNAKQERLKFEGENNQATYTEKSGSYLYIFICFLLALLGGLLGIYAGYIYSNSKIKDEHGIEYYVYDKQTRDLGKIIMWIGIAVLLFFLLRFCFS
jgi:hypothetical protein